MPVETSTCNVVSMLTRLLLGYKRTCCGCCCAAAASAGTAAAAAVPSAAPASTALLLFFPFCLSFVRGSLSCLGFLILPSAFSAASCGRNLRRTATDKSLFVTWQYKAKQKLVTPCSPGDMRQKVKRVAVPRRLLSWLLLLPGHHNGAQHKCVAMLAVLHHKG